MNDAPRPQYWFHPVTWVACGLVASAFILMHFTFTYSGSITASGGFPFECFILEFGPYGEFWVAGVDWPLLAINFVTGVMSVAGTAW